VEVLKHVLILSDSRRIKAFKTC